jgi:hypothetical protein
MQNQNDTTWDDSTSRFFGTSTLDAGTIRTLQVRNDSATPELQLQITNLPVPNALVSDLGVLNSFPNMLIVTEPVPTTPVFAITPSTHTFDLTFINENSAVRDFVIRNNGMGTLAVGAATLTGVNANQFTIITNETPANLNLGESAVISVRFNPTAVGDMEANLSIPHKF